MRANDASDVLEFCNTDAGWRLQAAGIEARGRGPRVLSGLAVRFHEVSLRAWEFFAKQARAILWLCGRVRVNYHGLSDFRSGHGDLPGGLLSEQVAALPVSGMAGLDEVAVDGT